MAKENRGSAALATLANARSNGPVSVLKFGGSSLKSIARIHHVADIIERRLKDGPVIVVVSAMGDTTDHLLDLAFRCCPTPDPRELDQLIATGEQVAISLLAMCLLFRGIKARSCTAGQAGIFADSSHSRARITHIERDVFRSALTKEEVLVIAGFQGVDPDGDITTLGRGGSDTTAVAIAARLGAACDIYTDVDGLFTADPNRVKTAKLIDEVPSNIVLALARAGAQVVHPRAVDLARQYNVPLRIRNTFQPDQTGTSVLTGEQEVEFYNPIWGVAADPDVSIVTLQFADTSTDVPLGILRLLSEQGIACDVCSTSPSSITLLLPIVGARVLVEYWERHARTTKYTIDDDVVRVSIVGCGLAGRLDVHSRLLQLLAREKISVKQIASTEQRVSVIVKESDLLKVEGLLHDEFICVGPLALASVS